MSFCGVISYSGAMSSMTAHQPKERREMGGTEVDVPYGSQWSFGRAVRNVTVKATSTREIELIASFLPSPLVSIRQTLRPTSVIIRMDLSAAMDLSQRLHEAFETLSPRLCRKPEIKE
jgi:hypothetical protein